MFPLTFQHRAGVSPYTSAYALAETCVFVKQLLVPILCGLPDGRHPFSRSYGVNLPSSLTVILPSALGFSPHLPVSVCGTGTTSLSRCFSWKHEIRYFGSVEPSPSRPRIVRTDLPVLTPSTLRPASNSWHILSFSVTPSIITIIVVLEYQPIVHRLRLSASP